jgi:hypothetical protein
MRAFQQWCQRHTVWWIIGWLVCLAILWLTGCATILSPNPQQVMVTSTPSGATVVVNSSPNGQTPTTINLDKTLSVYVVEVQKPGYAPYQHLLGKTVDPLFFLNILFLPGFLVDVATGQWQKFPDQVMAPMVPASARR